MSALTLPDLLSAQAEPIGPVVPIDLNTKTVCRLDFTDSNPYLKMADLADTVRFENLVQHLLQEQNATVGIGGYLENRVIYSRSPHFNAAETPRSVHLGLDIWLPAFTSVLAPLPGKVHSFQNNNHFGDYGPTIILEHQLAEFTFYTLYGHLTIGSLAQLKGGQEIKQGEAFTQVGPYPENGDWPPHLHLQLITDLMGLAGDFPGVCTPQDKIKFADICLDPNLLLKCKHLAVNNVM